MEIQRDAGLREENQGEPRRAAAALTAEQLRTRFFAAPDFEGMVAGAQKNVDLWLAVWRRAAVPDDVLARVAALGGSWHLLVLSADWCGDAVNTVPVVAKLAEQSPNVHVRIVDRDENPDLMNAHLTGTSRSIPVVIVLDEQFVERGWWGPRPGPLQQWALGEGRILEKDARYREIRTWYARDRGRTTLEEIVAVMEGGPSA